ncbi:unnamed protein product [Urochloa humidicola]
MARGAHGRFCGRGIASRSKVRRFRAQFRENQKQGDGGGGIGKVGHAGNRKLVARGGQIEQGGDYVVVRGRRIERAGLRINSQGEVYVPDSEEEDDMETEDVAPDVQARLDAVLAGIDPMYHDVYISLYKACH